MIIASLLLILVSVVTLLLGLIKNSDGFVLVAIAAALLAAIALVFAARRGATEAVDADEHAAAVHGRRPADGDAPGRMPRRSGAPYPEPTVGPIPTAQVAAIPTQPAASEPGRDSALAVDDEYDDAEPPDEPAPAEVSPADAARLAELSDDVYVIDGRPRYHTQSCDHLVGREPQPIPVSEAIELGFTPCGRCQPDDALLAQAQRG